MHGMCAPGLPKQARNPWWKKWLGCKGKTSLQCSVLALEILQLLARRNPCLSLQKCSEYYTMFILSSHQKPKKTQRGFGQSPSQSGTLKMVQIPKMSKGTTVVETKTAGGTTWEKWDRGPRTRGCERNATTTATQRRFGPSWAAGTENTTTLP